MASHKLQNICQVTLNLKNGAENLKILFFTYDHAVQNLSIYLLRERCGKDLVLIYWSNFETNRGSLQDSCSNIGKMSEAPAAPVMITNIT